MNKSSCLFGKRIRFEFELFLLRRKQATITCFLRDIAITPMDSDEFATYECNYSYDNANYTEEPEANMELVGTVNVQEDYLGNVQYLGQVKNTGTKGLIFGQVYFITRDTADSIDSVSYGYINGDTVTLSSIDTTTDTALNIGSTGTFSTFFSDTLFSSYGRHSFKMAWDDKEIIDGTANKAVGSSGTLSVDSAMQTRNKRIDSLRDTYLAN